MVDVGLEAPLESKGPREAHDCVEAGVAQGLLLEWLRPETDMTQLIPPSHFVPASL